MSSMIQLTDLQWITCSFLITQVSKGAIGPSHGLIFVLDDLKRYAHILFH